MTVAPATMTVAPATMPASRKALPYAAWSKEALVAHILQLEAAAGHSAPAATPASKPVSEPVSKPHLDMPSAAPSSSTADPALQPAAPLVPANSSKAVAAPVVPPVAAARTQGADAAAAPAAGPRSKTKPPRPPPSEPVCSRCTLYYPPPPKKRCRAPVPPPPVDFDQWAVRPIALKIAYFGTAYRGFAHEGGRDDLATIESVLFDALKKAQLIPDVAACAWTRSGRTDKGVHAFGQVVGLRVRSYLPKGAPGTVAWAQPGELSALQTGVDWSPAAVARFHALADAMDAVTYVPDAADPAPSAAASEDPPEPPARPLTRAELQASRTRTRKTREYELPYVNMLNSLLPHDIRVLAWAPVPSEFHARFTTRFRRYHYFFPARGFDLARMHEAAQHYTGTHDWRNFCKVPRGFEGHFERTLYKCHIRQATANPDIAIFEIEGQAFLWHQVRCMMAVLMQVGLGRESPDIVPRLLDVARQPAHLGRPSYFLADEAGLVLMHCGYPEGLLRWRTRSDETRDPSERAARAAPEMRLLQGWWGELRAARIRDAQLQALMDLTMGGFAPDGPIEPDWLFQPGPTPNARHAAPVPLPPPCWQPLTPWAVPPAFEHLYAPGTNLHKSVLELPRTQLEGVGEADPGRRAPPAQRFRMLRHLEAAADASGDGASPEAADAPVTDNATVPGVPT